MPKPKRSRRIKTPQEVQADADQRKRLGLIAAGVPAQQVEGSKVHDFETNVRSIRVIYPTVIDRWFAEGKLSGDPAYQDPQRAALEHCRGLWAKLGTQRLCANYTGTVGGSGDAEGYVFALAQLAEYQSDIPNAYWMAFENVARFDMPAGRAGSHLARTSAQQQAHAKAAVGFVLSLIALWRGY